MSDKETLIKDYIVLPKDYPIDLYLEQQKKDQQRITDLSDKFRRLRNER
jgi:hypothetical protein